MQAVLHQYHGHRHLDRAKAAVAKPSQIKKEEAKAAAPAQDNKNRKNDKKSGPSPSTLRHAVKKAEERMAQLTAEIARIDDDMANASVSNPKALEGLTRARAKTQADLDAAEAAWVAAEEALAEVT